VPKLFKQRPNANWSVRFQGVNGKRVVRSLGTVDEKIANKRAEQLIKEVHKGNTHILDQTRCRNTYSMIADIIELYLRDPLRKAGDGTAKTNANSLIIMLKELGCKDPTKVRSNKLSSAMVRSFFTSRMDGVSRGTEKWARLARTANSHYRKAKSIFSKRQFANQVYQDLMLPDLSGFMSVPVLEEGLKYEYSYIGDDVFSLLNNASSKLKETDPALYVVFLVCSTTGMRRNEVRHARWDWITHSRFRERVIRVPQSDMGFVSKSRRSREIPLPEIIFKELQKFQGQEPGYLIPSKNKTDRMRKVWDRLSAWFKDLGVNVEKPAHELRKIYGSQITAEHDIYIAQKLLGHSSVAVTEKYYADIVRPTMPSNIIVPPHLLHEPEMVDQSLSEIL